MFGIQSSNALCRQTNWTAECVSWNVSWRRQRSTWPSPTPSAGSCGGRWTTLLSRQMPWAEKSPRWGAGWGTDSSFDLSNKNLQPLCKSYSNCICATLVLNTSPPSLFKGVTRLSLCVRWLAPAWTVMMRWPCRLKLLSLQRNKRWGKGKLSPQMACKHSDIVSEDLLSCSWPYSLAALFSYSFISSQIAIFITVTYFSTKTFFPGVCGVVVSSVFTFVLEVNVLLLFKFGSENTFCLFCAHI